MDSDYRSKTLVKKHCSLVSCRSVRDVVKKTILTDINSPAPPPAENITYQYIDSRLSEADKFEKNKKWYD